MSTETATTELPPDVVTDIQAVADAVAAGRPIDPGAARRIQERSAQARKQLLASHGVQDVGVRLIRELRGELPAS